MNLSIIGLKNAFMALGFSRISQPESHVPVVLSMLAAEAFITIKVEDIKLIVGLLGATMGSFLSIRLSSSFGVFEDCQEGVRGKQFRVQLEGISDNTMRAKVFSSKCSLHAHIQHCECQYW